MTYQPRPRDTSDVELPPEMVELRELLARNTHALWADKRLADGWVYGPRLDAEARTHPNLVPYEELDEAEKEYDRTTAMEVLKVMLSLGYRITAPAAPSPTDRGPRASA